MVSAAPQAKRSLGRKNVEMKMIKKKTSRMVTFSKRRASLFRKASELATLCNAHVAIMIFSPGGKIYSFGHPSVRAVIDRYEDSTGNIGVPNLNHMYRADMRLAAVRAERTMKLKMELQQVVEDIEAMKNKVKMLDMVWEDEHARRYWWNAPVEEMNMTRCKELYKKLMNLKMEVEAECKKRNLAENAKKDLINQAIPSKNAAPNHSAGIFPNNLVAGWINSAGSIIHNFQGSGFCDFGGSTSTSASLSGPSSSTGTGNINHGLGLKSNGVGSSNSTSFNNFPF